MVKFSDDVDLAEKSPVRGTSFISGISGVVHLILPPEINYPQGSKYSVNKSADFYEKAADLNHPILNNALAITITKPTVFPFIFLKYPKIFISSLIPN